MPGNYQNSSTFQIIQPICAKIARECCLEDMIRFELILKEIDSDVINTFQEYLLFPFRISLLKNPNEKVTIKTLDIMTHIFDKSRLNSWLIFSNTITTIFQMISSPGDVDKVCDASEEFKYSVCRCISSMIENSVEVVRQQIYGDSFSLPLAHVFHTLLGLLRNERSKSLRKIILRTIGLFCYNRQFVSRDKITESYASCSLAVYLPGLSISLANVICGDNKQGESVIRLALKIFTDLIVITVGDQCPVIATIEDDSSRTNSKSNPNNSNRDHVRSIKNDKWFQEVATKLQILIQNTTVLVTHDHWKVRLDYIDYAESILCDCTKNLQNCVPVLLRAVFALSVDNHEHISRQGQKLILRFSEKFRALNSTFLCSLIEDDIYASTSQLIKCKLSANDDQKLFILKSIQGSLQILGDSIDKLLYSATHLEKLMLSLLNLLEFDTAMLMVEEVSVNLDICVAHNIMPKKRFCYFQKEEILDTICNICHCLGKGKQSRLVVDYLIESIHTSEIFILQSIFLIGCIVEGLSKESSHTDENIDLVGDIMDELLTPAMFDIPLHRTDLGQLILHNDQSLTETYNDSNIYQICLILETVEKCAKALGKTFKMFLIKVLFHIMEKAGSSNYIISQSGKICLYSLAFSCGYDPLVELIRDNADYLVNSIILNHHHFLYKPEMSAVLQVVLQESDSEMLPLFKDCVHRLLCILDYNQEKVLSIMAILKSVVLYVARWFPPKNSLNVRSLPSTSGKYEDLKTYFIERNKKKASLLSDSVSEDTEDCTKLEDETEDSLQESEVEKVPLHIIFVSEILKKCSNFQTSRNLQLRVLALEVMELCILALGDFKNEQHPLVHQLWNSFVQRFSEENIVMLQAFKVLLVIADECRDFVRVRCLKDVIPKLTALLKNNFSSSLLKNYIKSYQWSNDCKLQMYVLSEIGDLFVKLDVAEKDIAILVEVCLPYMQKSQPRVFREAAFKTLKALSEIDSDAIWFYFNDYYSEKQSLIPHHESLQPVHFLQASVTDSDFKFDF